MVGSIPVECFENPNVTHFDVGKIFFILIYPYFCLPKAKVMKLFVCIGNNVLTGLISPQIGNMANVKVLFLGKQLMISIFKYFLSSCPLLTSLLLIWI